MISQFANFLFLHFFYFKLFNQSSTIFATMTKCQIFDYENPRFTLDISDISRNVISLSYNVCPKCKECSTMEASSLWWIVKLPFSLPFTIGHFWFCVGMAYRYLEVMSSEPCVCCHCIQTSCWLGQNAFPRSLLGCRKSNWDFCAIRQLGQQIRWVWQGRPHNPSSGRL